MKITVTVTGQGAISTRRILYPSIKAAYIAISNQLTAKGYSMPCTLKAIYSRLSNKNKSIIIRISRGTAFTIRKA
jgi:hypothetical protein